MKQRMLNARYFEELLLYAERLRASLRPQATAVFASGVPKSITVNYEYFSVVHDKASRVPV